MTVQGRQLRQGDVLLHPIEALPVGVKKVPAGSDRLIVLARGEQTNHHHAIKSSPKVVPYSDGAMLYLEVREPVTVTHQEHAPLTLEPGCYEVRRQVEVWLDEVRQVAD